MTPIPPPDPGAAAVAALREHDASVATAESVTGGLVAGALTAVPGSSAVVLGGVVAYNVEMKQRLLGVPAEVLAEFGPVHPTTAMWMAIGVATRFRPTVAISTTGVAGPEPHGGLAPGSVFVAGFTQGNGGVLRARFMGSREQIRAQTVQLAAEIIEICAKGDSPASSFTSGVESVEWADHGLDLTSLRLPQG